MSARYDGHADWYEVTNSHAAEANVDSCLELLGRGIGPCLDLGCGTGAYAEMIKQTGREPIGVDISSDQLRHAQPRYERRVVLADAQRLPFPDSSFPTVFAAWFSTDVDDFSALLREIARVLAPGGLLVSYGVHPCFNGPHVASQGDARVIHPTYRRPGWHISAPWWGENGIRSRFGMRNVPLAEFWNAFIASGLTVDRVVEPARGDAIPFVLGLRAHHPNQPRTPPLE